MQMKKEKIDYRREALQVVGWLCLAITVLAVLSFNPEDHTLFYVSSGNVAITNWCGLIGAQLAGLFFYLFGSASYALLGVLLLPIYRFMRKEKRISPASTMLRVIGVVLTVAALGGLYQLDLHAIPAGGMLGGYASQGLGIILGFTGSMLMLWGMLWVQMILLMRLPLLPAMRYVAMLAWQGVAGVAVGAWLSVKKIVTWRRSKVTAETEDDFADVLQAAGAVRTASFQEPAEEPAAEEGTPEIFERMAAVTVRMRFEQQHFFKWTYTRLPNSVLGKNQFVAGADGVVPHQIIIDAYAALQKKTFKLPDVSFFAKQIEEASTAEEAALTAKRAEKITEKLRHFGVNGSVSGINIGPVVTMYEYKPDINSKISKIVGLEDDLAMALTAQSMRIIAPIPGKNAVGFEIANTHRRMVLFSQVLASKEYQESKAHLPLIFGVDAIGNFVVEDLAATPHLLVGGSTGAGKSVALNVMLLSLLCKRTPDELKLVLIDPKRLEFMPYADIPHLLFPIVTQPHRASTVLAWVAHEMERRYTAMAALGVRNMQEYCKAGHAMPFIVVIIDELADLMMVAGKDVEMHIVRIAQMARAAGIHLIVATQRPSVDVMTGLIKANFPSRIAFRVSSKIDSRTILDAQGAEKLLGKGDLLFMQGSSPDLRRAHCPYVADQEVERVAAFLRAQRKVEYVVIDESTVKGALQQEQFEDGLYGQVCDYVRGLDEISISMLQRQYRIGFNRSARLIEKLELDGLVAPAQGSKPRKVRH
jgi:S-DNA-T family DNA segregation ATPase FtsK/SpoIIIE